MWIIRRKNTRACYVKITGENFNFLSSKEVPFKLTMTEGGTNGRK